MGNAKRLGALAFCVAAAATGFLLYGLGSDPTADAPVETATDIPAETATDAIAMPADAGVADEPGFPPGLPPDIQTGSVTKIVDGDTIHIDAIRYRLTLIDTPERDEAGFWEAKRALEDLCPRGSLAYYDTDDIRPFDKYGRHLAVVWCSGNSYSVSTGEAMAELGLLEKYYTQYCETTHAAKLDWVEMTGDRFYYDACQSPTSP